MNLRLRNLPHYIIALLAAFLAPSAVILAGDDAVGGHVSQSATFDSAGEPADWNEVQALGHRTPARRDLARHRLLERGPAARDALVRGLTADSFEVRASSRKLLTTLDEIQLQSRLYALLAGSRQESFADLPGWSKLCSLISDSGESRRLYGSLLRSHGASLKWLDSVDDNVAADVTEQLASLDTYLPLDANRINDGDPARWGLILMAASQPNFVNVPVLTSRVRGGLLNVSVQERLEHSPHYPAIQSLIGQWLRASAKSYVNSTMLKIALTYNCHEEATELAQSSLDNPHSAPSSIATSLVLVSRLEPEIARRELKRWVHDNRVCHVWQIVTTGRRAVRTQVGDVAVALLLHLDGMDPREHGFSDLQADPLLIFREFSMGFEDDAARQLAYASAGKVVDLGL